VHYENHAYKIEGEELPDCRLSLKIEVKAEEASKAYKKAVKKINK
jgi:FKBP-type peptidyl-prolyl cis-trans isomerase (trigger factor)